MGFCIEIFCLCCVIHFQFKVAVRSAKCKLHQTTPAIAHAFSMASRTRCIVLSIKQDAALIRLEVVLTAAIFIAHFQCATLEFILTIMEIGTSCHLHPRIIFISSCTVKTVVVESCSIGGVGLKAACQLLSRIVLVARTSSSCSIPISSTTIYCENSHHCYPCCSLYRSHYLILLLESFIVLW